jgi:hypothetical protein
MLLECASSTTTKTRSGSRYLITSENIANSSASNALELIQQLRPEWLNPTRGPKSFTNEEATEPVVYVNNARYGDIDYLQNISILNIQEISFLKGDDATTRFGTGHVGGAILITLK